MFVCLHTLTVHMLVCVCISNFLWLGGNKISLSRTLDLRWKIVHVFKEDRNCTEDLCPCLCHLLWVFAPLVRPKAKAFLGCSCEPAGWKQSWFSALMDSMGHTAAGLSGSLPPTQVSSALCSPVFGIRSYWIGALLRSSCDLFGILGRQTG